jgi:hypothetical protein
MASVRLFGVLVFCFSVLMRVDLVQGVDLGVGGWG